LGQRFETVRQVAVRTPEELRRNYGFGERAEKSLVDVLAKFKIALGAPLPLTEKEILEVGETEARHLIAMNAGDYRSLFRLNRLRRSEFSRAELTELQNKLRCPRLNPRLFKRQGGGTSDG
jgi:hypothetical protein